MNQVFEFCDSCKISHKKSCTCSTLLHLINMFGKSRSIGLATKTVSNCHCINKSRFLTNRYVITVRCHSSSAGGILVVCF